MKRDYRLYELNDDEFERLVVQIAVYWFGVGVTPFAPGRDGGRDGKFLGTAERYPSTTAPLFGNCVFQAKHVNAPDRSCSDKDFQRLLQGEHPQITRLIGEGICEHYLVFTNRKLTGGAEEALQKQLLALGLKTAHIIGVEKMHEVLEAHERIRRTLPNIMDVAPFRFDPDEFVEVVQAFHSYSKSSADNPYDSAHDFEVIKLTEKNSINGLSKRYFDEIIAASSMPHFDQIRAFLSNPRNTELAALYADAADELKEKILLHRTKFSQFDHVFAFLYEEIQRARSALRGKRRLVSILLHYMYCNCEIGVKSLDIMPEGDTHAHA